MNYELFSLRYREGHRGVLTGFIRARDLATAIRVGNKFCNSKINARFISVEIAILADETILEDEAPRPVTPKVAAPPVVSDPEDKTPKLPETTVEEEQEARAEADRLEREERIAEMERQERIAANTGGKGVGVKAPEEEAETGPQTAKPVLERGGKAKKGPVTKR